MGHYRCIRADKPKQSSVMFDLRSGFRSEFGMTSGGIGARFVGKPARRWSRNYPGSGTARIAVLMRVWLAEIIAAAHRHLSAGLVDARLACRFLPPTFTLDELQRIYETLLDAEIDKRNLRTWAAALEQIEPTGEQRSRDPRPPARLYRSKTAVDAAQS